MRSADYVEETTTSIAGSGAGAVTLTQITNVPRFSTVFGTQNTDCRYIIEDTVNFKVEIGLGKVSSNVLTRTRPQITWDGTTWDDSTPTALTFSASPTSGDIKIRMGAVSGDKGSVLPAIQSTIAGDSSWRDYPISHASQFAGAGKIYALTADREYYTPYLLNLSGLLTGIQFKVETLIASSNMKMALYSCGSDGLPGEKIVGFNVLATDSTGVKTDTTTSTWTTSAPVRLTPGWYYIGLINSHAPSIRASEYVAVLNSFANPLGRKDVYGYGPFCYVAGSYSTGLPQIPSLGSGTMISTGTVGSPWIGLKVVA